MGTEGNVVLVVEAGDSRQYGSEHAEQEADTLEMRNTEHVLCHPAYRLNPRSPRSAQAQSCCFRNLT